MSLMSTLSHWLKTLLRKFIVPESLKDGEVDSSHWRNLKIHENYLLENHCLPFLISRGLIGRLSVDIPWNLYLSDEAIRINIDDILISVVPYSKNLWNLQIPRSFAATKRDQLIKLFMNNLKSTNETEIDVFKSLGIPEFIQKSLQKWIFTHLEVKIRNLHICFECGSCALFPLSIGLFIPSFSIKSPTKNHDNGLPSNKSFKDITMAAAFYYQNHEVLEIPSTKKNTSYVLSHEEIKHIEKLITRHCSKLRLFECQSFDVALHYRRYNVSKAYTGKAPCNSEKPPSSGNPPKKFNYILRPSVIHGYLKLKEHSDSHNNYVSVCLSNIQFNLTINSNVFHHIVSIWHFIEQWNLNCFFACEGAAHAKLFPKLRDPMSKNRWRDAYQCVLYHLAQKHPLKNWFKAPVLRLIQQHNLFETLCHSYVEKEASDFKRSNHNLAMQKIVRGIKAILNDLTISFSLIALWTQEALHSASVQRKYLVSQSRSAFLFPATHYLFSSSELRRFCVTKITDAYQRAKYLLLNTAHSKKRKALKYNISLDTPEIRLPSLLDTTYQPPAIYDADYGNNKHIFSTFLVKLSFSSIQIFTSLDSFQYGKTKCDEVSKGDYFITELGYYRKSRKSEKYSSFTKRDYKPLQIHLCNVLVQLTFNYLENETQSPTVQANFKTVGHDGGRLAKGTSSIQDKKKTYIVNSRKSDISLQYPFFCTLSIASLCFGFSFQDLKTEEEKLSCGAFFFTEPIVRKVLSTLPDVIQEDDAFETSSMKVSRFTQDSQLTSFSRKNDGNVLNWNYEQYYGAGFHFETDGQVAALTLDSPVVHYSREVLQSIASIVNRLSASYSYVTTYGVIFYDPFRYDLAILKNRWALENSRCQNKDLKTVVNNIRYYFARDTKQNSFTIRRPAQYMKPLEILFLHDCYDSVTSPSEKSSTIWKYSKDNPSLKPKQPNNFFFSFVFFNPLVLFSMRENKNCNGNIGKVKNRDISSKKNKSNCFPYTASAIMQIVLCSSKISGSYLGRRGILSISHLLPFDATINFEKATLRLSKTCCSLQQWRENSGPCFDDLQPNFYSETFNRSRIFRQKEKGESKNSTNNRCERPARHLSMETFINSDKDTRKHKRNSSQCPSNKPLGKNVSKYLIKCTGMVFYKWDPVFLTTLKNKSNKTLQFDISSLSVQINTSFIPLITRALNHFIKEFCLTKTAGNIFLQVIRVMIQTQSLKINKYPLGVTKNHVVHILRRRIKRIIDQGFEHTYGTWHTGWQMHKDSFHLVRAEPMIFLSANIEVKGSFFSQDSPKCFGALPVWIELFVSHQAYFPSNYNVVWLYFLHPKYDPKPFGIIFPLKVSVEAKGSLLELLSGAYVFLDTEIVSLSSMTISSVGYMNSMVFRFAPLTYLQSINETLNISSLYSSNLISHPCEWTRSFNTKFFLCSHTTDNHAKNCNLDVLLSITKLKISIQPYNKELNKSSKNFSSPLIHLLFIIIHLKSIIFRSVFHTSLSFMSAAVLEFFIKAYDHHNQEISVLSQDRYTTETEKKIHDNAQYEKSLTFTGSTYSSLRSSAKRSSNDQGDGEKVRQTYDSIEDFATHGGSHFPSHTPDYPDSHMSSVSIKTEVLSESSPLDQPLDVDDPPFVFQASDVFLKKKYSVFPSYWIPSNLIQYINALNWRLHYSLKKPGFSYGFRQSEFFLVAEMDLMEKASSITVAPIEICVNHLLCYSITMTVMEISKRITRKTLYDISQLFNHNRTVASQASRKSLSPTETGLAPMTNHIYLSSLSLVFTYSLKLESSIGRLTFIGLRIVHQPQKAFQLILQGCILIGPTRNPIFWGAADLKPFMNIKKTERNCPSMRSIDTKISIAEHKNVVSHYDSLALISAKIEYDVSSQDVSVYNKSFLSNKRQNPKSQEIIDQKNKTDSDPPTVNCHDFLHKNCNFAHLVEDNSYVFMKTQLIVCCSCIKFRFHEFLIFKEFFTRMSILMLLLKILLKDLRSKLPRINQSSQNVSTSLSPGQPRKSQPCLVLLLDVSLCMPYLLLRSIQPDKVKCKKTSKKCATYAAIWDLGHLKIISHLTDGCPTSQNALELKRKTVAENLLPLTEDTSCGKNVYAVRFNNTQNKIKYPTNNFTLKNTLFKKFGKGSQICRENNTLSKFLEVLKMKSRKEESVSDSIVETSQSLSLVYNISYLIGPLYFRQPNLKPSYNHRMNKKLHRSSSLQCNIEPHLHTCGNFLRLSRDSELHISICQQIANDMPCDSSIILGRKAAKSTQMGDVELSSAIDPIASLVSHPTISVELTLEPLFLTIHPLLFTLIRLHLLSKTALEHKLLLSSKKPFLDKTKPSQTFFLKFLSVGLPLFPSLISNQNFWESQSMRLITSKTIDCKSVKRKFVMSRWTRKFSESNTLETKNPFFRLFIKRKVRRFSDSGSIFETSGRRCHNLQRNRHTINVTSKTHRIRRLFYNRINKCQIFKDIFFLPHLLGNKPLYNESQWETLNNINLHRTINVSGTGKALNLSLVDAFNIPVFEVTFKNSLFFYKGLEYCSRFSIENIYASQYICVNNKSFLNPTIVEKAIPILQFINSSKERSNCFSWITSQDSKGCKDDSKNVREVLSTVIHISPSKIFLHPTLLVFLRFIFDDSTVCAKKKNKPDFFTFKDTLDSLPQSVPPTQQFNLRNQEDSAQNVSSTDGTDTKNKRPSRTCLCSHCILPPLSLRSQDCNGNRKFSLCRIKQCLNVNSTSFEYSSSSDTGVQKNIESQFVTPKRNVESGAVADTITKANGFNKKSHMVSKPSGPSSTSTYNSNYRIHLDKTVDCIEKMGSEFYYSAEESVRRLRQKSNSLKGSQFNDLLQKNKHTFIGPLDILWTLGVFYQSVLNYDQSDNGYGIDLSGILFARETVHNYRVFIHKFSLQVTVPVTAYLPFNPTNDKIVLFGSFSGYGKIRNLQLTLCNSGGLVTQCCVPYRSHFGWKFQCSDINIRSTRQTCYKSVQRYYANKTHLHDSLEKIHPRSLISSFRIRLSYVSRSVLLIKLLEHLSKFKSLESPYFQTDGKTLSFGHETSGCFEVNLAKSAPSGFGNDRKKELETERLSSNGQQRCRQVTKRTKDELSANLCFTKNRFSRSLERILRQDRNISIKVGKRRTNKPFSLTKKKIKGILRNNRGVKIQQAQSRSRLKLTSRLKLGYNIDRSAMYGLRDDLKDINHHTELPRKTMALSLQRLVEDSYESRWDLYQLTKTSRFICISSSSINVTLTPETINTFVQCSRWLTLTSPSSDKLTYEVDTRYVQNGLSHEFFSNKSSFGSLSDPAGESATRNFTVTNMNFTDNPRTSVQLCSREFAAFKAPCDTTTIKEKQSSYATEKTSNETTTLLGSSRCQKSHSIITLLALILKPTTNVKIRLIGLHVLMEVNESHGTVQVNMLPRNHYRLLSVEKEYTRKTTVCKSFLPVSLKRPLSILSLHLGCSVLNYSDGIHDHFKFSRHAIATSYSQNTKVISNDAQEKMTSDVINFISFLVENFCTTVDTSIKTLPRLQKWTFRFFIEIRIYQPFTYAWQPLLVKNYINILSVHNPRKHILSANIGPVEIILSTWMYSHLINMVFIFTSRIFTDSNDDNEKKFRLSDYSVVSIWEDIVTLKTQLPTFASQSDFQTPNNSHALHEMIRSRNKPPRYKVWKTLFSNICSQAVYLPSLRINKTLYQKEQKRRRKSHFEYEELPPIIDLLSLRCIVLNGSGGLKVRRIRKRKVPPKPSSFSSLLGSPFVIQNDIGLPVYLLIPRLRKTASYKKYFLEGFFYIPKNTTVAINETSFKSFLPSVIQYCNEFYDHPSRQSFPTARNSQNNWDTHKNRFFGSLNLMECKCHVIILKRPYSDFPQVLQNRFTETKDPVFCISNDFIKQLFGIFSPETLYGIIPNVGLTQTRHTIGISAWMMPLGYEGLKSDVSPPILQKDTCRFYSASLHPLESHFSAHPNSFGMCHSISLKLLSPWIIRSLFGFSMSIVIKWVDVSNVVKTRYVLIHPGRRYALEPYLCNAMVNLTLSRKENNHTTVPLPFTNPTVLPLNNKQRCFSATKTCRRRPQKKRINFDFIQRHALVENKNNQSDSHQKFTVEDVAIFQKKNLTVPQGLKDASLRKAYWNFADDEDPLLDNQLSFKILRFSVASEGRSEQFPMSQYSIIIFCKRCVRNVKNPHTGETLHDSKDFSQYLVTIKYPLYLFNALPVKVSVKVAESVSEFKKSKNVVGVPNHYVVTSNTGIFIACCPALEDGFFATFKVNGLTSWSYPYRLWDGLEGKKHIPIFTPKIQKTSIKIPTNNEDGGFIFFSVIASLTLSPMPSGWSGYCGALTACLYPQRLAISRIPVHGLMLCHVDNTQKDGQESLEVCHSPYLLSKKPFCIGIPINKYSEKQSYTCAERKNLPLDISELNYGDYTKHLVKVKNTRRFKNRYSNSHLSEDFITRHSSKKKKPIKYKKLKDLSCERLKGISLLTRHSLKDRKYDRCLSRYLNCFYRSCGTNQLVGFLRSGRPLDKSKDIFESKRSTSHNELKEKENERKEYSFSTQLSDDMFEQFSHLSVNVSRWNILVKKHQVPYAYYGNYQGISSNLPIQVLSISQITMILRGLPVSEGNIFFVESNYNARMQNPRSMMSASNRRKNTTHSNNGSHSHTAEVKSVNAVKSNGKDNFPDCCFDNALIRYYYKGMIQSHTLSKTTRQRTRSNNSANILDIKTSIRDKGSETRKNIDKELECIDILEFLPQYILENKTNIALEVLTYQEQNIIQYDKPDEEFDKGNSHPTSSCQANLHHSSTSLSGEHNSGKYLLDHKPIDCYVYKLRKGSQSMINFPCRTKYVNKSNIKRLRFRIMNPKDSSYKLYDESNRIHDGIQNVKKKSAHSGYSYSKPFVSKTPARRLCTLGGNTKQSRSTMENPNRSVIDEIYPLESCLSKELFDIPFDDRNAKTCRLWSEALPVNLWDKECNLDTPGNAFFWSTYAKSIPLQSIQKGKGNVKQTLAVIQYKTLLCHETGMIKIIVESSYKVFNFVENHCANTKLKIRQPGCRSSEIIVESFTTKPFWFTLDEIPYESNFSENHSRKHVQNQCRYLEVQSVFEHPRTWALLDLEEMLYKSSYEESFQLSFVKTTLICNCRREGLTTIISFWDSEALIGVNLSSDFTRKIIKNEILSYYRLMCPKLNISFMTPCREAFSWTCDTLVLKINSKSSIMGPFLSIKRTKSNISVMSYNFTHYLHNFKMIRSEEMSNKTTHMIDDWSSTYIRCRGKHGYFLLLSQQPYRHSGLQLQKKNQEGKKQRWSFTLVTKGVEEHIRVHKNHSKGDVSSKLLQFDYVDIQLAPLDIRLNVGKLLEDGHEIYRNLFTQDPLIVSFYKPELSKISPNLSTPPLTSLSNALRFICLITLCPEVDEVSLITLRISKIHIKHLSILFTDLYFIIEDHCKESRNYQPFEESVMHQNLESKGKCGIRTLLSSISKSKALFRFHDLSCEALKYFLYLISIENQSFWITEMMLKAGDEFIQVGDHFYFNKLVITQFFRYFLKSASVSICGVTLFAQLLQALVFWIKDLMPRSLYDRNKFRGFHRFRQRSIVASLLLFKRLTEQLAKKMHSLLRLVAVCSGRSGLASKLDDNYGDLIFGDPPKHGLCSREECQSMDDHGLVLHKSLFNSIKIFKNLLSEARGRIMDVLYEHRRSSRGSKAIVRFPRMLYGHCQYANAYSTLDAFIYDILIAQIKRHRGREEGDYAYFANIHSQDFMEFFIVTAKRILFGNLKDILTKKDENCPYCYELFDRCLGSLLYAEIELHSSPMMKGHVKTAKKSWIWKSPFFKLCSCDDCCLLYENEKVMGTVADEVLFTNSALQHNIFLKTHPLPPKCFWLTPIHKQKASLTLAFWGRDVNSSENHIELTRIHHVNSLQGAQFIHILSLVGCSFIKRSL